MADNVFSTQDKTIQGFVNALENLPLLISVFTGKTSMLLRQKPTDSEEKIFFTISPKLLKIQLTLLYNS